MNDEAGDEAALLPCAAHAQNASLSLASQQRNGSAEHMLILHEERSLSCIVDLHRHEVDQFRRFFCPKNILQCLNGARPPPWRQMIANDFDHQIFVVRKLCTLMPRCVPSLRACMTLGYGACCAYLSFLIMTTHWLPVSCIRVVCGSVYKNTLQACIFSEVLDDFINLTRCLRDPTRAGVEGCIRQMARRLTSLTGALCLVVLCPSRIMSGHLLLCTCSAAVGAMFAGFKGLSQMCLRRTEELIVMARAQVRLSPDVLHSRRLVERKVMAGDAEWTLTDLRH